MSVEDRDWYREDFKRKEKEYGGDFSLNSEPKHKEKSTGKKKKQQLAQPARPAISSWRRTLNSVLMILLCAILTASSCYNSLSRVAAVCGCMPLCCCWKFVCSNMRMIQVKRQRNRES